MKYILLFEVAVILFLAFTFGDTPTIATSLFASLVICGLIGLIESKKYGNNIPE